MRNELPSCEYRSFAGRWKMEGHRLNGCNRCTQICFSSFSPTCTHIHPANRTDVHSFPFYKKGGGPLLSYRKENCVHLSGLQDGYACRSEKKKKNKSVYICCIRLICVPPSFNALRMNGIRKTEVRYALLTKNLTDPLLVYWEQVHIFVAGF